jgi:peptide/nickel transport system ATP-binding protein
MRLEAHHISKAYQTGWMRRTPRPVLQDVDLSLDRGETVGVVGKSGAGKTTLGCILTGILRPDSGMLRYEGADFWTAEPAARKEMGRKLQMVLQHPESAFNPRWSMRESLAEPFRLRGAEPTPDVLAATLAEVGIAPTALQRRPHQMSGGELQRLAIARVMALKPAVVVLDEPTGMLDALTQAAIMNLLKRIQERSGVSYILISHDPVLVHRFSRHVYRLENGRLSSEAPLPPR